MQPIKGRILFVEDHEDTRDLMALILEQSNYEVLTASSIAGALELVKAERFDLFMLDSLLIDGTGLELCKRIRAIALPQFFFIRRWRTRRTKMRRSDLELNDIWLSL